MTHDEKNMKGEKMIKKFFSLSLVLIISLVLLQSASFASEGRGQRMFDQNLKKACGTNGLEVARKHTQAEWTKIYESNGLDAEMKLYCPEAKPFKDIYTKDVYEFFYALAKDSGKVIGAC